MTVSDWKLVLTSSAGRLGRTGKATGPRQDGNDVDIVVQRLRLLEPTPEPQLAAGKNRMLAEAARLSRQPVESRGRRVWSRRLQTSMAVMAVLAVVAFASFTLGTGAWSGNGVTPKVATPRLSPTYVVTPTRIALAPATNSAPGGPALGPAMVPAMLAPTPLSVPDAARPRADLCILEWHSYDV